MMTVSASPALKQVETALKITPGSFANKNYHSVFDIVRTSRKQFIADNMSWLGLRGGKAWDLAVGQAQHIRRLFRESQLTRQVRESVQRKTLSGQPVRDLSAGENIQGLVQDGPTWRNQFAENWQNYCQSGAPEAVDSPVSYLTWLYKQALTFEQEINASSTADQVVTLAERRPDLATLTVDNDAVNQQIPALQLVNEILEENIATILPADQSVDETLAETRYPTLLPYHFPHDQVALSLLNADVPLEAIIGQTSTDWPWFLNDSWQGARSSDSTELASRLAPEQQTLVIEADNSTASDLTDFYKTNLGLATADYTPFENLDTFTRQLGITVPQVEGLVAGNGEGSTSVVISPNITTFDYEDLAFTDAETANGRFGNALSLYNRQGSYANFIAGSGPFELMKGDKSFSSSMWINVSAQPTDNQMPIICNCLMDSANQGIRFCVNSGDFLLGVTDSNKKSVDNAKKKTDGTATTVSYNVWYLVCLTWDSVNKKATVYYQAEGESAVSTIEVDASTLTGDITTAEGFTWVLNDSGDMSYYTQHPVPATLVNCLYDDMGLVSGVLVQDDFNKIFSAGVVLSDISSQLSAPLAYYYAMNSQLRSGDNGSYGASFINAGIEPVILMDAPEESELIFSNTTYVNGKYGQGIQTRSNDDSYFYFKPDGEVAQAMKGDKSFTLGFWMYRVDLSARRIPFFSNGGDANDNCYSSGFMLTSYNSGSYIQFAITDDEGNLVTNSWNKKIDKDQWYYIALSWNAENRKADWYTVKEGDTTTASTVTLSASALKDITTAEGFTWAFNTRGDLTREDSSTDNIITLIYDDIAVFNGALTASDINTIVMSGKPVAETDLSGFPAACIWSSSLDRGLRNLSDARMDRINRMVRLQRWLGLSYEETDLLLSACIRAQGTDNTDFSLNAHTLRTLGVFRHWQQKYGVTAFEFAAVLDVITPYAISPAVPFLDQVFNSPSLFDTPFAITGETVNYAAVTGDSARTVRQICAGLEITQAQFRVLADRVAAEQGDAEAKTFPLTLAAVSAFYRLVMVPRWLGLSFADGAALLSLAGEGDTAWTTLAGVPQLAALTGGQPADGDILDLLMALDAAAAWAAEHQLSWVKNWLALQPGSDALVATAATVNFVNSIKQQLPAALLSEQSFATVPLPDYKRCFNIYNGSTPDDSPLGKGHGFKLDSTQSQYAVFTDTANNLTNGNASYTIGVWVKVTSGASVNFPILANASDYNAATSTGIYISLSSNYHLNISIASDNADSPLVSDTSNTSWPVDKWFWLAIATDTTQQTVTVYAWSEDGSIKSSVELSYKGSILPEEGNGWAISQNGALDNTSTHGVISYDDITIWNRTLTADNVAEIVASGKPAAQILPATLSDYSFLTNLIDTNGLVLPAATDYSTITVIVAEDIDAVGITFATDAEREQAISALSGIINQARLAQDGIADSALSQMFGTTLSLSPFLLQWADDSEYRLLSDSLTLNDGAALTDPSQVPATYLADLFALGQRAGISTAFGLTPATLSLFLAHPEWFGVSDTTLSLTLLYRFSRYGDWLKVAEDEDRVLAYLSWVNAATPPDAAQAAEALALLLGWESSEVADATAGLPGGLAKTVTDVDYVLRLQQLSAATGLSVTPLLATGELAPGGVSDTWDAWQSAGESLVAAQSGQQ